MIVYLSYPIHDDLPREQRIDAAEDRAEQVALEVGREAS